MTSSTAGSSTAKSSSNVAPPFPGHVFPFELNEPTKHLPAQYLFGPPIFIDGGTDRIGSHRPGTMMRDLLKLVCSRDLTAGRMPHDICPRSRKKKPPVSTAFLEKLDACSQKLRGETRTNAWRRLDQPNLEPWKLFTKFDKEDAAAAEATAGTVNDKA